MIRVSLYKCHFNFANSVFCPAVLTRHQPSAPVPTSPAANAGPVVRARMELGPSAGRHSPLAESAGFLEMRVAGCRAELLASTLSTLGPFLEDELSADVQPMRLHLDNATITLKAGVASYSVHFPSVCGRTPSEGDSP